MAMEAATRTVITGSNSVYLDENRSCTVRKEHTPESEMSQALEDTECLGSAVTWARSYSVTVTVTTKSHNAGRPGWQCMGSSL